MGIEPMFECWETCVPDGNEKFGNNLRTKPWFLGRFWGVPTPTKAIESSSIWRKRVGVEPTPESAKDTGYGFEDHEDHRAPFASGSSIEEG
jgi:hypothetical protein